MWLQSEVARNLSPNINPYTLTPDELTHNLLYPWILFALKSTSSDITIAIPIFLIGVSMYIVPCFYFNPLIFKVSFL